MTAEQIHDALTLLPADLIAEADRKRNRKPKVIVWKRYAAMAACFVLVLCSSLFCMQLFTPKGETEAAPAEAAVMQENSIRGIPATEAAAASAVEEAAVCGEGPAEDMQTDTTTENASAAAGTLCAGMSPPKYLDAIPAATTACFSSNPAPKLFRSRDDLEVYRENSIRFQLDNLMDACESYDENWFETHDLLLITLCGVPAGDRSEITAIRELDGRWEICVENDYDSTEAERTDWHILIETEKGLIESGDDILLVYE